MTRPFEGVRVIDASHVLAGPFATYQLGLLGAEVIRIENPRQLDLMRTVGPPGILKDAKMGALFLAHNANKKSIAIDLKTEQGREIVRKLSGGADVFLENFRPGRMAKLGLGYADLKIVNEQLIYCSLTGFGQDGPRSNQPAYDHVLQAASGIMSVTGTEQSGPLRVGFPIVDCLVGLLASFAVASALFQRTHTGRGQYIDVAMLDAALVMMGPLLAQWLILGQTPSLLSNKAFSGSPFSGVFETSQGTLVVVANSPTQCGSLLQALGRHDLLEDPRIANWTENPEHSAGITAMLRDKFRQKGAADWEAILLGADVPVARVRDLPSILADPQMQTRDLLQKIALASPLSEEITVPGVGFKLVDGGAKVTAPPPLPGAHTEEILRGLGHSTSDIEHLTAQGIVCGSEKWVGQG